MKWNPFRVPTALENAVVQLEQAKRERLEASCRREHYSAMETMLCARTDRLREDIVNLSQKGDEPWNTLTP